MKSFNADWDHSSQSIAFPQQSHYWEGSVDSIHIWNHQELYSNRFHLMWKLPGVVSKWWFAYIWELCSSSSDGSCYFNAHNV